jgi:hypothetical protein
MIYEFSFIASAFIFGLARIANNKNLPDYLSKLVFANPLQTTYKLWGRD